MNVTHQRAKTSALSMHPRAQRAARVANAPVVTQRAVHMKASAWEALQRLCNSYDTSVSKVIESLVIEADHFHASQED
ncbi:hypothetical protein [Rugamonas aquatica]|uniref:Uncharacterized protein n=1 Tax=Rugamonas aquatica TaxID=2743357 RepID=A0A6A7MYM7_9BURK|nr:hypothetical protein [Rugamonas aquatica]MQA37847.1 hypothetical protein [Rugamonas aquatica]